MVLSLGTTLSLLLENSLGYTLGESDCESLGTTTWYGTWYNTRCWYGMLGIQLDLHFANPITKHLIHGTELEIWITIHLVLSSASFLEVHLVLNLVKIWVLILESSMVYRFVLRLVVSWGIHSVVHWVNLIVNRMAQKLGMELDTTLGAHGEML